MKHFIPKSCDSSRVWKFAATLNEKLLEAGMSNARIQSQIQKKFDEEVGLTGEHPSTIIISDDNGSCSVVESDVVEALLQPGVRGLAIIGDVDGKPAIRFFWIQ